MPINEANIYKSTDCGTLLAYNGIPVITSYVEYNYLGVGFPAYCLDKTKNGAETGAYSVSVNSLIQDVKLWRIMISGYPYKSLSELGVHTKEEAFTATKHAIYCYIHGNDVNSYSAVGEAGQRTLNALKQILNVANNSTEINMSNTINIDNSIDTWKEDNIDNQYISKVFSVNTGSSLRTYTINNIYNGIEGVKITDLQNGQRNVFVDHEQFKVLIPIKNIMQKDAIELEVTAQVATKPILFGQAPNNTLQNYALTGETYEDGYGKITDYFPNNETKIKIIKQDSETLERLEGVEFRIFDENKNVIYSNLKTDANGEILIEKLVPGKYYIEEVNSIDGYDKYDEQIEIELKMNQQYTVTVNNNKEDEPKVEIEKEELNLEVSIKKLPVTGM